MKKKEFIIRKEEAIKDNNKAHLQEGGTKKDQLTDNKGKLS